MTRWQRDEAEIRIRELLDAAKGRGPQKIVDTDGDFEVTFSRRKQTLEQLFAAPGPLADDDLDR